MVMGIIKMSNFLPVINMPLSDDNLHDLGRLTAVWGQMDYLMTLIIARILDCNPIECEILLERTPTAAKKSRLERLSSRLIPEVEASIKKFCKRSDSVLGKRNHLTHGMWVMFSRDGISAYQPACYFPDNKKALIYAAELKDIVNKAIEVTNLLAEIHNLIYEVPDGPDQKGQARSIYMGYGHPEGRYTGDVGSIYIDLLALGHSAPNP